MPLQFTNERLENLPSSASRNVVIRSYQNPRLARELDRHLFSVSAKTAGRDWARREAIASRAITPPRSSFISIRTAQGKTWDQIAAFLGIWINGRPSDIFMSCRGTSGRRRIRSRVNSEGDASLGIADGRRPSSRLSYPKYAIRATKNGAG